MASRIAGITIEIGGDTTKLQASLSGLDKSIKSTASELKDVNKLLKLNPKSTELLTQKQARLKESIKLTQTRLEELKKAQDGVGKGTKEWDALQREIIATEGDLKNLQKQMNQFGSVSAQKIKAVGEEMKTFGGKVEGVGRKLAPVSGAATALLGGLVKLGHNAITAADDLNTLSKQTGISTKDLQKFKYASDLVDVSLEDITGAYRKLKANMDPANESFKKLGVTVTNADGTFRNVNDVFNDSIKALSGIKNETERDKLAMEIFGKSADSLAGIIDDGGEAFREYGQKAEEMGIILSQDTLDALNKTNDTVDELKMKMGGSLATLGATLAEKFAPAIEKVAGFLGTLAEKIKNLTPEQTELIVKIAATVAALAPLLIAGGKIITIIGTVLTKAPLVVTAIKTLMSGGLSPVTLVIAAVIAAGILLYKNWDKIKATAIAVKNGVVSAWNSLKSSVMGTWNTIKSGVVNAANGIKNGVVGAFNAVKSGVSSAINGLKNIIESLATKINNVKTRITQAVDKIKGIFNFSWSLPHIKLPHFWVQGGVPPYGIGGRGSLPRIGVSWYRRAYENPVVFTQPTVLQTATGYKGFGDGHGAEIVMGLNKLRELVGTAGDVTVNVYAQPGTNVNELADAVVQRIILTQQQRSRAYA